MIAVKAHLSARAFYFYTDERKLMSKLWLFQFKPVLQRALHTDHTDDQWVLVTALAHLTKSA